MLLIGNSGTGKTHLASGLAFAACNQGRRVLFFTATGLVTRLLEKREERQMERFCKQLENQHLIVLDELGYVPFSKTGAELLFEVVSRAYERTSLIVTTNLPFEAWTDVMGNERLTGALLDRLTHRIHVLEANGESYRLRESKDRQKQPLKRRQTTGRRLLIPAVRRDIPEPGWRTFGPPRPPGALLDRRLQRSRSPDQSAASDEPKFERPMRAVHSDDQAGVPGQVHCLRQAVPGSPRDGVCRLLQHGEVQHSKGSPAPSSLRGA